MSQLQVGGVSTGTGTVALRPPGTNSNRTLILPDYDGNLGLQALIERRTLTGSAQQEITGIPEWVGQITIDFAGVSGGSSGTIPRIQLGSSASYPTAYAGAVAGESAAGASAGVSSTFGAPIFGAWDGASSAASGRIVFSRLLHVPGVSSRWVFNVNAAHNTAVYTAQGAGYGDFAAVVDRLRFTTSSSNFTGGQMVVRMEA